ncbi:MAG TPA: hypothetical protein VNW92_20745 [Polyangiaceae bacterium]|nr:hypothetical protein [Polyangiaceae bacterium]
MRTKSKFTELAVLLEEMLAETGGPFSAAERRKADAALGMQKPVGKTPRKRTR